MADTILIVEDEKDLLHGLERTIKMAMDCEVITAENGILALQHLSQKGVDLVLADIRMPEMDGITLLKEVKRIDPSITVVIMTGYGSIEEAVAAIKMGAYDFIQKPFNEERLLHLLQKGLELNRLVRENARLIQTVREKKPYSNMVGQSRPMQQVFETIEMLAQTDVTVLILGETGTGKELAAKAIHTRSARGNNSLVTVNCPALPETILESELFGYQKGAFTNADKDTEGLFLKADGSTIFLDEIGDISSSVQTKLLRFLQDKKIQPLGAGQSRYVDARIIAATNQDLNHKMDLNQFRKDLFYRLNVATLIMPSLRDIKEDIPLLVDHFLRAIAKEQQSSLKQISQEMLNSLMAREWPGNTRELENTIRGWCALTVEDVICTPPNKKAQTDPSTSRTYRFDRSYKDLKEDAIQTFTLDYLHQLLQKTNGNISLSAKLSGIKRQSLQKIIKRYQIDTRSYHRQ